MFKFPVVWRLNLRTSMKICHSCFLVLKVTAAAQISLLCPSFPLTPPTPAPCFPSGAVSQGQAGCSGRHRRPAGTIPQPARAAVPVLQCGWCGRRPASDIRVACSASSAEAVSPPSLSLSLVGYPSRFLGQISRVIRSGSAAQRSRVAAVAVQRRGRCNCARAVIRRTAPRLERASERASHSKQERNCIASCQARVRATSPREPSNAARAVALPGSAEAAEAARARRTSGAETRALSLPGPPASLSLSPPPLPPHLSL